MDDTRRPVRVLLRQAALWSAATTIIVLAAAAAHLLPHAPDEFTYDWRAALLSDRLPGQRKDIALVLINDKSIASYPSRSPVDRGLIAELVKAVDAAEPKAIGLDFAFDRHSDPAKDDALLAAIRQARTKVILGVTNSREGPIEPASLRWQCEFVSAANRPAGPMFFDEQRSTMTLGDDVIRKMDAPDDRQTYECGGRSYRYGKTFDMLLAEVDGARRMPENRLIAWQLPPRSAGTDTFTTIYVADHSPVDGRGDGSSVLPPYFHPALKGKIVIIGGDFIDRDQHRIPLSVETRTPVPGAFVHAQIVAQLRDGRSITEVWKIFEMPIVFSACFLGFLISSRYFLFGIELFAELVFVVAIVCVGSFVFYQWKIALPTSTIFLSWLLGAIGGGHYHKVVAMIAGAVSRIREFVMATPLSRFWRSKESQAQHPAPD